MKKILLLVFLFLANSLVHAQDCPQVDTIYLTTQQEIDAFPIDYPDCTSVDGSVVIKEAFPGAITNLDGLNQITSVEWTLYIQYNTALEDLSGLENLVHVGNLSINYNSGLVSLDGLSGLETIGDPDLSGVTGSFWLGNNDALENIEGLSNLQYIAKRISMRDNPVLVGLSGLSSLHTISSLSINNCDAMVDLSGIPELTELNSLTIRGCDGLTSLQGLEHLIINNSLTISACPLITTLTDLPPMDSLQFNLEISGMDNLTNLDGLEGVKALSSILDISYNTVLESISALSTLTAVESNFQCDNNPMLTSFEGLENLITIGREFNCHKNHSLTDLSGLQNLETIGENCQIYENNNLTSLTGLASLTSVGDYLFIGLHPLLTDITALQNLSSIIRILEIRENASLENLNGLEACQILGNSTYDALKIWYNPVLSDISAIANMDLSPLDKLTITHNNSLSLCSQQNICNYLLEGGEADIYNNAPGCDFKNEVLEGCFEGVPHSYVVGNITADLNGNCDIDIDEPTVSNWLINVDHNDYHWVTSTDSLGNYWLPVLEGEWTLNAISPFPFWTPCFSDTLIYATAINDSIATNFVMEPQGDCSYIDWDMSIYTMRACHSNSFSIPYCNQGALPAEDLIIQVTLDTFMTFENASVPYTIDGNGNYYFNVGTVDLFDCGEIYFSAFLDCDSVSIWDLQCVNVMLYTEDLCSPDSIWDQSLVSVSGFCENDSIFFQLQNVSMYDMSESAQFRVEIVIDDIVLLHDVDEYQLNSQQSQQIGYPMAGQGMRLEADQTTGFPLEDVASVIVPSCDDIANNELFLLLPISENGNPYQEMFCTPVTGSFDPNDKTAIPGGSAIFTRIKKDWPIQYTVNFQNTGNDTAFLVVIRDIISDHLDINSLSVNGASHPFTWEMDFGRTLSFRFENILLPDSTTNEPASHGFVNYTISPIATILPNERIFNTAAIFFDFNDPIITNTTQHIILKPIVATSSHLPFCAGDEYEGNIILADTTIQLLTSYAEYDSIHFLHLDMGDFVLNEINIVVSPGEVFQGVLIESDTVFTQSFTSQQGCDSIVTYSVSALTSLETFTGFEQVVLFPVPTGDVLSVLNHQTNEQQYWQLRDVMGVTVWEKELDVNEMLGNIKLNQFSRGVYFLEVRTARSGEVWKVVFAGGSE